MPGMKKRSFLLFEILIAFLLVALCAVPLVRQPLTLFRAEMRSLELLERERLADWTFSEIKEKLLKNEIPWEKIPSKGNKSTVFRLPPSTIRIPGCAPKQIERTYTIACRGEKIGLQDEIYRSLRIKIEFSPPLDKGNHFTFSSTVQKLPCN